MLRALLIEITAYLFRRSWAPCSLPRSKCAFSNVKEGHVRHIAIRRTCACAIMITCKLRVGHDVIEMQRPPCIWLITAANQFFLIAGATGSAERPTGEWSQFILFIGSLSIIFSFPIWANKKRAVLKELRNFHGSYDAVAAAALSSCKQSYKGCSARKVKCHCN